MLNKWKQFNLNLLKITLRLFNRPRDVPKQMKMNKLKTNVAYSNIYFISEFFTSVFFFLWESYGIVYIINDS